FAGRLRIATQAEMPQGGPVEPSKDERLLEGRLLARVDVDVGEGRLPRVGQAPGPGVDLEAGLVAEPTQGRGAVGDQVVVGFAVGPAIDAGLAPASQPRRRRLRDVLLPET